jgi:hypothetical protein
MLQRIAHLWSGYWWSHEKGIWQCYTVTKSLLLHSSSRHDIQGYHKSRLKQFLGCLVLLAGGTKSFDLSNMDVGSYLYAAPAVRSRESLAESSIRIQCWSTKYKGVDQQARADGNHGRRSGRSKSKAWATPVRCGSSGCRWCGNEKPLFVSPLI